MARIRKSPSPAFGTWPCKGKLHAVHRTLFDKGLAGPFDQGGTDKGTSHSYLGWYEDAFFRFRDEPIRMLEIGVANGRSLALWRDYFSQAEIIGVDLATPVDPLRDPAVPVGVEFHQCNATTPQILSVLGTRHLDIAIDDGSHNAADQEAAFHVLRSRMKPGGLYVIEDIWQEAWAYGFAKQHGFTSFDFRLLGAPAGNDWILAKRF